MQHQLSQPDATAIVGGVYYRWLNDGVRVMDLQEVSLGLQRLLMDRQLL